MFVFHLFKHKTIQDMFKPFALLLLCSRHGACKCVRPFVRIPKRLHHSQALVHKGTSRWRAKESAMSLCLLPAKKQRSGIKRGLWFQAHRSDKEALSLTETRERSYSVPQSYKLVECSEGLSALISHPSLFVSLQE